MSTGSTLSQFCFTASLVFDGRPNTAYFFQDGTCMVPLVSGDILGARVSFMAAFQAPQR